MVLKATNEKELSKFLGEMTNKRSTGYGEISKEILKCCFPIVEHYLAKVINKCILEEIFLDSLKKTKVLPLLETGGENQPGNCRPKLTESIE